MPLFLYDGDEKWVEAKAESGEKLLNEVYEKYAVLAETFSSVPSKIVGPADSLYVGQRECAVVPASHADDTDTGIRIIGSDDATTCHVVIACHHSASGELVGSVAHFDDANATQQISTFLRSTVDVLRDTGAVKAWDVNPISLDVYIIGGFSDNNNGRRGGDSVSEKISIDLLWSLRKHPTSTKFNLKLACISKLNNAIAAGGREQRPAVLGAAIDLKTGEIFPCTFSYRGPEAPLRTARAFSDQDDLLNVYDHEKKRVSIEPFRYYRIGNAEKILNLPDEWILKNMSTSPNAEPAHFASTVREMLKFTVSNPDWRDYFASGAVEYEKRSANGGDNQGWLRVKS